MSYPVPTHIRSSIQQKYASLKLSVTVMFSGLCIQLYHYSHLFYNHVSIECEHHQYFHHG